MVEGEKLFDRLLASRFPLASALATPHARPRTWRPRAQGVPVYVLPHRRGWRLVRLQPAPGCARLRIPSPLARAHELAAAARPGPGSILVVCPQLDNPENLGNPADRRRVPSAGVVAGPVVPTRSRDGS